MNYFPITQKVSEPKSSKPPFTMELTTTFLMLSQVTNPDEKIITLHSRLRLN